MNRDHRTQAIDHGLAFLATRQLPSGQFPVEATYHYKPGSPSAADSSPFATAHVAYSLGFLPSQLVSAMLQKALFYLRREMSEAGLWRYWNRDTMWQGRAAYGYIPADLDDTASHAWLLRQHGIDFPTNRHLFLHNRDSRGRFYTWFVPRLQATADLRYWRAVLGEITLARMIVFWKTSEANYNDVDAVVNANVIFYLGEGPEAEPVIEWLRQIIEESREAESDKWYRDIFTFYYAVSRCHHAGIDGLSHLRPLIRDRLAATVRADGGMGDNPLHTALALNTLFNLGINASFIDRAVEHVVATQSADGGWPTAPYYYGGPRKLVSWGSRDLTTGLCLEALSRAGRIAVGPTQ